MRDEPSLMPGKDVVSSLHNARARRYVGASDRSLAVDGSVVAPPPPRVSLVVDACSRPHEFEPLFCFLVSIFVPSFAPLRLVLADKLSLVSTGQNIACSRFPLFSTNF